MTRGALPSGRALALRRKRLPAIERSPRLSPTWRLDNPAFPHHDDKVFRRDVLGHAFARCRANDGAFLTRERNGREGFAEEPDRKGLDVIPCACCGRPLPRDLRAASARTTSPQNPTSVGNLVPAAPPPYRRSA